MAKIAHLILAHRSPDQITRLVEALEYPSHDIYIHIDKKADIAPFCQRLKKTTKIHFTQRKRVDWGAYNIVDATLSAMSEIIASDKYDFINLLSGSDYPLVKPEIVDGFLDNHSRTSFMEFLEQGSPWWDHAKSRTEKIHLTDYRFKGKYLLQHLVNMFPFKRTPPLGLELVGRSQWFTIASTHASYVLRYVEKHPAVVNFFKHTWAPDEFFFQTILFSSHFRDEIINDNLRYIDWDDGKPSPKTLTMEDWPALKTSTKFFARKFDSNVDARILDCLDKYTLYKKTGD